MSRAHQSPAGSLFADVVPRAPAAAGGVKAPPATPVAIINPEATTRLREAGIDAAEVGAGKWIDAAIGAIRLVAGSKPEFVVDDVQALLAWQGVKPPREGRAMGAAMREARRLGIIEPTGAYTKSNQPQCHGNPRCVWRAPKP